MKSAPRFVRQFILDVIVTFVASVAALNLAIPGTLSEIQAQGFLMLSALGTAIGTSFVRNWPDAIEALKAYLGLAPIDLPEAEEEPVFLDDFLDKDTLRELDYPRPRSPFEG